MVVGIRRFLDAAGADPRLDGTAVQTVGAKGHDGFAFLDRQTTIVDRLTDAGGRPDRARPDRSSAEAGGTAPRAAAARWGCGPSPGPARRSPRRARCRPPGSGRRRQLVAVATGQLGQTEADLVGAVAARLALVSLLELLAARAPLATGLDPLLELRRLRGLGVAQRRHGVGDHGQQLVGQPRPRWRRCRRAGRAPRARPGGAGPGGRRWPAAGPGPGHPTPPTAASAARSAVHALGDEAARRWRRRGPGRDRCAHTRLAMVTRSVGDVLGEHHEDRARPAAPR